MLYFPKVGIRRTSTQIILHIAIEYIFGFDPDMKDATGHFVHADAADAAKNGTLQHLVNRSFD